MSFDIAVVDTAQNKLKEIKRKTRTELPSCEAIDVRNVNFGDIVRPDTKIKAVANLLLLPT